MKAPIAMAILTKAKKAPEKTEEGEGDDEEPMAAMGRKEAAAAVLKAKDAASLDSALAAWCKAYEADDSDDEEDEE